MTLSSDRLVLLGVGQVARAIAEKARGKSEIYGTTRSAKRCGELQAMGIKPLLIDSFENFSKNRKVSEFIPNGFSATDCGDETLEDLFFNAKVVVSFPPDESADSIASALAKESNAVVYISSTAVYGKHDGEVNEHSEVDEESEHAVARLSAERKWRKADATIIRAAGIYGRGNGLHKRLLSGHYKLPGDGSNYVSRVHVDDLSDAILNALDWGIKTQLYLAGDELPTTHREIVEWLSMRLNVPFPQSVPLEQCHYTQQGNRKVDSRKFRWELKKELAYPTYKEGYGHELEELNRAGKS